MAALPSPTQVAGTHNAIYEAYYHQVDPNGTGAIQALDAARFLKKSRISDVVLSKIWDLSDPTGKGYLDKAGLFVALKLVALAQGGREIHMSNIHADAPPPKVGEIPKVSSMPPARPAAPAMSPLPPQAAGDWSMKPAEREKYNQLFEELQPNNGLIAGNKVKGMLMESKLPLETLGKIWDLADQDKDGMLDRHEFMVAMHLVYKALEKHAIPTSLPAELRAPHGAPHVAPGRPAAPPSRPPSALSQPLPAPAPAQPVQWVVTAAEAARFDAMFAAADADRDGLVSGAEIKNTLLESGLPQATLAHIWALCDRDGVGKLNGPQFALAMWLVQRARRGLPPPAALAPDMVPPAPHAAPHGASHATPLASVPPSRQPAAPLQPVAPVEPASLGPQPTPELEALARSIDALVRERAALEHEVACKERDLAARAAEANSLQSELDTLTATLKQLENQKGEANKRLADLKSQVEKLRSQVAAQEAAASETEAEVTSRRAAAQTLKEKERALQEEARRAEAEAEEINEMMRKTVIAVSQANIKLAHLEEAAARTAAATAALAQPAPAPAHLTLRPLHRQLESPTHESNSFGAMNGAGAGSGAGSGGGSGSGFESDPFKDAAFTAPAHDPFAPQHQQEGFGSDAFSSAFPTDEADPFAPSAAAARADTSTSSGAWEADPFAVLHAPSRDTPPAAPPAPQAAPHGAPGPVLPPKKHKTPPPRPAPPRPNPPHKTEKAMEFTEDPFKDYRYEDPFNIEDPFADATDSNKDDKMRPTSVVGFETDDFFGTSNLNGTSKPSGRVSAPPVAYDPFNKPEYKPTLTAPPSNNNDAWASWPNDSWADDAWAEKPNKTTSKTIKNTSKFDAWSSDTTRTTTDASKTDNWGNKTDNWATDWGDSSTDFNKNLNETWPSNTLPSKKEKSPKPVKYAKSIVHTIGGIGRTRHNKKKEEKEKEKKAAMAEVGGSEMLATEEHQMAWAAAESKRLQMEAEARRRREDEELQLALAISRQEK